uniref:Uncharacterized protein n=1 Tax=uncultured prokaryote TaxID=198431 RepID=A0A0H5QIG5_9ZZZZ|nr:hypothetical protein [uncultured prokaryote]
MPTAKPRIAVTLEQSTFEVIARMAALQGVSRGSIVADLLDSVAPSLARTVSLLEAAAAAPKQVQDGLREVVEAAHDDFTALAGDATRQLDMLLDAFARTGVDPHVVTRGSGITPPASVEVPKKPRKRSKPGGTAHE